MNVQKSGIEGGFGRQMARGSAWMVSMRWAVRGIGIVSTVILARLLTPADFGVVAMAMFAVGFVELLSETGQKLHLIRHLDPTRDHWDSAWTLSIVQGVGLAALLYLIAPLAASYFQEPRVVMAIRVLSLRPLLRSFENIGVVAFRRELDFAREFRLGVYRKLSSFAVTVVLAVVLRSYWALLVGIVVGGLAGVVISYRMHPYRPKLCTRQISEIWSFSAWILVVNVGHFVNRRCDEAVVGGFKGTSAMGNYNVASDVATAPTLELIMPIGRTLFPLYSKLLEEPEQLKEAYVKVLSTVALLACSTGVGVALVATDFVAVVLGAKWAAAAPLVMWLSLAAAAASISNTVFGLLNATNRPRVSASLSWARALVLVPTLILAGWFADVEAIAAARTAVTVAFAPLFLWTIARFLRIPCSEMLRVLWRPAAAAALMALAVQGAHLGGLGLGLRLALDVTVGAVVFTSSILGLWYLAGRPDGVEREVLTILNRKWHGSEKIKGRTR